MAATLIQLFPEHSALIKWVVILSGLAYLVVAAVTTYPRLFLERKRRAAQQAADEREYRTYEHELAQLRAQFSTDASLDDRASSSAYQTQLTALNERHREMLTRKFGSC